MNKILHLLLLAAFAAASSAATAGVTFTYRVAAQGVVAPPTPVGHVALSTGGLTFDPQYISTSSAVKKITVTNDGNAALSISNIALDTGGGGYAVTHTCSAPLLPLGTCNISVVFTPTSVGTFPRNVIVSSNALQPTTTIPLSGSGIAPPGPSGNLVKIVNGAVLGIALNAQNEVLYLAGRNVHRVSSTGDYLGSVFNGAGFAGQSNCNSSTPNLRSLAVDPANGSIYLGGSCTGSSGHSYAALYYVFNGTYADKVAGAWGSDSNNNALTGLSALNGQVYASFWTNSGISYQARITRSGGATQSIGTRIWSSNMTVNAANGQVYLMATSGSLLKYTSGTTWTSVSTVAFGDSNAARLASDADGFLYFVDPALASLRKIDSTSGAIVKTWPLTGVTGGLSGLQVSSTGTPYISTSAGVWRMD